jgi:uncharacterized protein
MLRLLFVLAAIAGGVASAAAQNAVTGEGTPIVPVATEADYQRVVENAVNDYIVPAYGRLERAAAELKPAVAEVCRAASADSRDALEKAFIAAITAWADVDFLRFGPVVQEGRYERFAFWPDVHGTGARQLRRFLASEDEALLAPGALARQSAAVQGLPALESLLFSGSKALIASEAPEPYRCALAETVADNLKTIATETLAGWSGEKGWAALIEKPGPRNPVYRTHAEAMTEILKGILTGLEQLRDHRLVAALGDSPDQAKASRAPYNSSGQALAYMSASADAVKRFADASGILRLLPDNQTSYANSVGFEFRNLEGALGSAGTDLEAALADEALRGKLTYAAVVVQSLRDLFQKRIAVWAGLTVGFNSLDGD